MPSTDGRYDTAARDAALKALIATGLFDKVTIDRVGDGLVVHVTEAKVLGRVTFEGNKKVKDADLTAAVQSKARGSLQRATVQGDVNRIVEAYRRVGRDDVSVAPEIIDRGNDRVDLVFNITEGKKTPVQKINFVGNHAFGNRQLNAIIKTSASQGAELLHRRRRLRSRPHQRGPRADQALLSQPRLCRRQRAGARAEYDPATKGFAVTFTIDEGQPYRFGKIDVVCNVPGLDPQKLRGLVLAKGGAGFDGGALDKTTDALAIEMAKLGYPFAQATPRIARDASAQRVDVTFVVEEGQRTYVERIEIHGNTRTQDYVIRREFDFGEGDPYNKTLIDRAERRLKNLNYFKTVKISTRPGSTPDRVVLDVEAVDQSTGDFFVSGGYSTTDGWLAEVKVGDRNFYGTGNAVQATVTYGQYAQGGDLSLRRSRAVSAIASPAGIDLFGRQAFASPYQSYGSNTYGATLSLGTPVSEQTSVQWRYSLYDQNVTLDPTCDGATVSLPVQQAAAAGRQLVSAVGDTVTYNTLDNNKMPTNGINSQLRQDIAGLGGDVRFLRTTEDVRYYQSLDSDLVGMVRAQGGYITGWGGQQRAADQQLLRRPAPWCAALRRTASARATSRPARPWIMSAAACTGRRPPNCRAPSPAFPRNTACGHRPSSMPAACSATAGRPISGSQTVQVANKNVVRSSVGVGLTWASPFGALTVELCGADLEGLLRQRAAVQLQRQPVLSRPLRCD